jgi:hypothetical protein
MNSEAIMQKFWRHLTTVQHIPCFTIDRLIDGGGNTRKPITVGVTSRGKQAIRVGAMGQPLWELQKLVKKRDELEYIFEANVTLSVVKQSDGLVYILRTPDYVQSHAVPLHYKTIAIPGSDDLDAVHELQ